MIKQSRRSSEATGGKGGIRFDAEGRHNLRNGQSVGSRIECLLGMTADQCRVVESQMRKLISPEGIITVFNGAALEQCRPLEQFSATLPTEIASDDGFLRRVNRETTVQ